MGAVKEKYEGKFTGTSEVGDFQEALRNAIGAAQVASGGADIIIKWRLDNVTGESGGLRPINKLYVTIQALDLETSRS
jgi:hypothetical protein